MNTDVGILLTSYALGTGVTLASSSQGAKQVQGYTNVGCDESNPGGVGTGLQYAGHISTIIQATGFPSYLVTTSWGAREVVGYSDGFGGTSAGSISTQPQCAALQVYVPPPPPPPPPPGGE